MKIHFDKQKKIYEVECEDSVLHNSAAHENLLKIIKEINNVKENTYEYNTDEKAPDELKNYGQIANEIARDILDRGNERLPNDLAEFFDGIPAEYVPPSDGKDNIVDFNKLNLKRPGTYSYFRCPECGQSLFITVKTEDDSYFLMRDIENSPSKLYGVVDDIDFSEYEYGATVLCDDEPVVIVNNDGIKGECPMCMAEYPIGSFIAAYEHPYQYGFEYDNICDVCGGEMFQAVSKGDYGSIKNTLTCDDCGYTKEEK